MNKQKTELEEVMLNLEDAYWRLRDLQSDPANFPDEEASDKDKVSNIITELGEYFA